MRNDELIKRNALIYERYKCQLDTIDPKEIEQFRLEVRLAYNRIANLLDVQFVGNDPYPDLERMTSHVDHTGILLVSKLHNDSNLLSETENLMFRAVHDYFHYLLQQPFDFKGELNVYKATKYLHKSDIGKRLLYSEIVLQASYCTYFNGFSDKQKVIINF